MGDASDGLRGALMLPLPSGSISLGGLGELLKPGLRLLLGLGEALGPLGEDRAPNSLCSQ